MGLFLETKLNGYVAVFLGGGSNIFTKIAIQSDIDFLLKFLLSNESLLRNEIFHLWVTKLTGF